GEVIYDGDNGRRERMSAKEAFARANAKADPKERIGDPLEPFGKDSLAIMSSNAYAAAIAVLAVRDAEDLLGWSYCVVALRVEALNGNVSPFLASVHAVRPYRTQGMIAENIRKELVGSFLWELWPCKDKSCDDKRALQDPLSFRTASQVLAVARDAVWALEDG